MQTKGQGVKKACCCKHIEEKKLIEPDEHVASYQYNTRFQAKKIQDERGRTEKLYPLREVPMGGPEVVLIL